MTESPTPPPVDLLPLPVEVWNGPDGRLYSAEQMHAYARAALAAQAVPAADAVRVDDAMIQRAMQARIPGGSQAWVWLFNCEGGMAPEEKHRDFFRRVLVAALSLPDTTGAK